MFNYNCNVGDLTGDSSFKKKKKNDRRSLVSLTLLAVLEEVDDAGASLKVGNVPSKRVGNPVFQVESVATDTRFCVLGDGRTRSVTSRLKRRAESPTYRCFTLFCNDSRVPRAL